MNYRDFTGLDRDIVFLLLLEFVNIEFEFYWIRDEDDDKKNANFITVPQVISIFPSLSICSFTTQIPEGNIISYADAPNIMCMPHSIFQLHKSHYHESIKKLLQNYLMFPFISKYGGGVKVVVKVINLPLLYSVCESKVIYCKVHAPNLVSLT